MARPIFIHAIGKGIGKDWGDFHIFFEKNI